MEKWIEQNKIESEILRHANPISGRGKLNIVETCMGNLDYLGWQVWMRKYRIVRVEMILNIAAFKE